MKKPEKAKPKKKEEEKKKGPTPKEVVAYLYGVSQLPEFDTYYGAVDPARGLHANAVAHLSMVDAVAKKYPELSLLEVTLLLEVLDGIVKFFSAGG